MDKLPVKIFRVSEDFEDLPSSKLYDTTALRGWIYHAAMKEPVVIDPMSSALVPTNLKIELPVGFEAQIRPRSGLAFRNKIILPNSPGTIDSDYRGEIKVIMMNLGAEPFVINRGDRIAQMVIS